MELIAWFVVFLVFLWAFYWYLNRPFGYWEEKGIPWVPAIPILGSQLEIMRKPFHEIDMERHKKYGRIYGHYEGNRPILNIADPELLKNIFVKDFPFFVNRRNIQMGNPIANNFVSVLENEKWKRVRNLMTPAFTTGKIKKMMSIILDCAKTLCENFAKSSETGQHVDAKKLFGAFTMDVITSAAFATKVDSHNDPENKFVALARKAFSPRFPLRAAFFFFFPFLFRLSRVSLVDAESLDFYKGVTLKIVEERKRTRQIRNDFLQLMMEAAGEVESSSEEPDENIETEDKGNNTPKRMTRNELVAQCIIFFLAGYETTAATLAFASYLLAINPDCQERLIEEIDETLSKHEGDFTYEAVQSMKYLENVILETLRLFPPAVRLERVATDDYELGYAGLTIPKGMLVGIPVYAIHHDPENYPDPEKFDPDRFTTEAKAERNQYTYLPFGSGPRNCLGMRFALMEIKTCLVFVLRQFRLKRCPETKVPLEYFPNPGFLQPKSLIIAADKRTDKTTKI